MHITFRCPQCEQTVSTNLGDDPAKIACGHCEYVTESPPGALEGGRLARCLICPSKELFVRKNFPQRLGVTLVVLGFAISCVTWYFKYVIATFAVLFATAGIDVLLYLFMGEVLECYRCHAQYTGVAGMDDHKAFDLEVHERHRQEKIRLGAEDVEVRG